MGSPYFRFKQFTVWHDRCAMKVGTDGVLLGAWCGLPQVSNSCVRVLDIGTGSGLIALMLAQRLEQDRQDFAIYGIDIESSAVEQSRINFEQSPWASHLSAIERGERKPTLETLYRISCALQISMSEIVTEIEKRLSEN
jgi:tRNA1Val (adenine37-N6)-methyltransferase